MHPADLYSETRRRVVALAADLDPGCDVPACPGWTVRDVIAHLVGLAADVAGGRVDGYAGAVWTANQVESRSTRTMPELFAEWDDVLEPFLEINRDLAGSDLPEMINHVLGPVPKESFEAAFHVDLLHHEHDLLGAAKAPRRSVLPADVAGMKAQLANVRRQFGAAQLPTLLVSPTDLERSWKVGTATPSASVSAPTIELFRAFGGRRTHDEIRAFHWSGDHDGMAEHLVLAFFEAPLTSLAHG